MPETYFKSDSGRIVEQSIFSQPPKNAKYVEPDINLFSDGPDFTDVDNKHLKKNIQGYFKNHNQFQTSEYITPGQKTIKLDSGRTIICNIAPSEKELARCPKPKNNLIITPNKYADPNDKYISVSDEYQNNVNIDNNINNANNNGNRLFGKMDQNEPLLQQPKIIIPNDELETKSGKTTLQNYCNPNNIESFTQNETFQNIQDDMSDELYKQILRTSAKAISDWLLNFKPYKPWINNWEILKNNLEKTNLNVSKLPINDKEIAYTLDKGEIIKFRWQDNKRYISKDIFMYVLLHELTHESFPKSFQGHGDPFPQILCLLCVAATEIGILNIENIPRNIYMSNGRPITSRESIKSEILFGINMLMEANKNDPKIIEYYQAKQKFINKYS